MPLEGKIQTLIVGLAESVLYITISDDDEDSHSDETFIPGSPAGLAVVNAANDSPIHTEVFLQSQTADPDFKAF